MKLPKNLLVFIIVVILITALPLFVYLSKQQQDIRSKASGTVTFTLTPSSATKGINETFTVNMGVDTGTINIDSVQLALKYDTTRLELLSFVSAPSSSTTFNSEVRNRITPTTGTLDLTLVDTTDPRKLLHGNVTLGTLTFKTKTVLGDAQVSFDNPAVGSLDTSGISAVNNTLGHYNIVAGGTPVSPTPNGGGNNTVSFFLSPTTATKGFNENLQVTAGINTGNINIDSVQLTLRYDNTLLDLLNFTSAAPSPTTFNSEVRNKINGNGTLDLTLVDTTDPRKLLHGNVTLGTLNFRTRNTAGTALVNFDTAAVGSLDTSGISTVNTGGTYTIEAGGGVTVVPTSSVVPTQIPTTNPTATTVPTRVPQGTSQFRYAEDRLALQKAPWQVYSEHPIVIDYIFQDKKPGLKFIWVQFKDQNGNIKEDNKSIELVIEPEITGCSFERQKDKILFTIKGVNFGLTKGKVLTVVSSVDIISWSDSQVQASLRPGSLDSKAGIDRPVYIDLIRADKKFTTAACSDVATSFLSLGAKLFCPQVLPHRIDDVELSIVEATKGGQLLQGQVGIDEKGTIEGLSIFLKPGSKYNLGIKVPKGVRQILEFIAELGTTNITDFTHHGKRLALGDIFPLDGGDGKINSLDKSELNREWLVDKPLNPDTLKRLGDLNTDERVNSFDWACMRYDFNKEDAEIPKPSSSQKFENTGDFKTSSF